MDTKTSRLFACILLMLLLAAAPAFSRGVFSVGVGANISYPADGIVQTEPGESGSAASSLRKGTFSFDDVAVGLETRVSLSYLQVAAVGELSVVDSSTILATGILTAGLSFDMFSLFRLGIAAGPKVSYAYTEAGSRGGASSSDPSVDLESTSNGKNFWSAVREGNFNLRFTFDIIAGPVLTFGVAYVVPTDFSIAKENYGALIPSDGAWSEGKISVCVQMSLF